MANQSCCICNSDKNSLYKIVGKYRLLRCNKCSLVYLDQDNSNQKKFIEDAKTNLKNKKKEKVEYWSFPELYAKYRKVFESFFNERLRIIKKYNKNIKDLLDVGCGYGFWMNYCEKRGIECGGIDISSEAVDFARNNLKLDAWKKDLMDFKTHKKYDLIMVFDVLEHLKDPNKALAKCRNLLKKGGLLYIQVPNLTGFKITPNHGYGLPYHLWQFSFKTLSALLKKNGYNVLDHWTGPMGVIGEYEKNENLFLKKIIWKVASKLYLGDRLQVIARMQ